MLCFVADGMFRVAAACHCGLKGSYCDISRLSTVEGKKGRKAAERRSTRAAQGDVSPAKLSVPVGRPASMWAGRPGFVMCGPGPSSFHIRGSV